MRRQCSAVDGLEVRPQQPSLLPVNDGVRRRLPEHHVQADSDVQVVGDLRQPRTVGEAFAGNVWGGKCRKPQGHQLVIGGRIGRPQSLEILRPLPVPGAEMRCHGRVHSAYARVHERGDRGIGVRRTAGVVREVEHRGDAAVERGDRGETCAEVDVLGLIRGRDVYQVDCR